MGQNNELKTFLNEFLAESVQATFSSISLTPAVIEQDIASYVQEAVNSTIYLKGKVTGKICFFLSQKNAGLVVSQMLGTEVHEDSNEVLDGIGEILNMIIGGIKNRCVAEGYDFEISIPSTRRVSSDQGIQTQWDNLVQRNFECGEMTFQVTIFFRTPASEEKIPPSQESKPKISAADLLNQLINKKMSSDNG